eukprot:6189501-Pleurochrysis_carterae.AAC.2
MRGACGSDLLTLNGTARVVVDAWVYSVITRSSGVDGSIVANVVTTPSSRKTVAMIMLGSIDNTSSSTKRKQAPRLGPSLAAWWWSRHSGRSCDLCRCRVIKDSRPEQMKFVIAGITEATAAIVGC